MKTISIIVLALFLALWLGNMFEAHRAVVEA